MKGGWEKEGSNYEVSFNEKGKEVSCVVNSSGTIIETETEIQIAELPAAATAYMKKHYAHQKLKNAAKLIDDKGAVTYEAALAHKDVIFDQDGKFIKESKD
jgi:hypothetical protein